MQLQGEKVSGSGGSGAFSFCGYRKADSRIVGLTGLPDTLHWYFHDTIWGYLPAPQSANPPVGYAGLRSSIAGPLSTFPLGSNRDPWQGQSQLFSVEFQPTMHLRCVQTALQ